MSPGFQELPQRLAQRMWRCKTRAQEFPNAAVQDPPPRTFVVEYAVLDDFGILSALNETLTVVAVELIALFALGPRNHVPKPKEFVLLQQ